MKRALTYLIVALLSCVSAVAQDTVNAKESVVSDMNPKGHYVRVNPKWQLKPGVSFSMADGFGGEMIASYYPYSNSWFRVGTSVQSSYFYSNGKKEFYRQMPLEQVSETRFNFLVNLEFSLSKDDSFYIGIDPYIGVQLFSKVRDTGYVYDPFVSLGNLSYCPPSTLDFGMRIELGGYIGKAQRHGLAWHLQFSTRVTPDDRFFVYSAMDYKIYTGFSYIFRIK